MARRKMPDALIWDYVVRPDPTAWHAACDWVLENEEPGRRQDVFVCLWRWRATHFTSLSLLVEQLKQASVGEVRGINLGSVSISFSRRRNSIRFAACCREKAWTDYWGLHNQGGQRLLNKQVLRLIDTAGDWTRWAVGLAQAHLSAAASGDGLPGGAL